MPKAYSFLGLLLCCSINTCSLVWHGFYELWKEFTFAPLIFILFYLPVLAHAILLENEIHRTRFFCTWEKYGSCLKVRLSSMAQDPLLQSFIKFAAAQIPMPSAYTFTFFRRTTSGLWSSEMSLETKHIPIVCINSALQQWGGLLLWS